MDGHHTGSVGNTFAARSLRIKMKSSGEADTSTYNHGAIDLELGEDVRSAELVNGNNKTSYANTTANGWSQYKMDPDEEADRDHRSPLVLRGEGVPIRQKKTVDATERLKVATATNASKHVVVVAEPSKNRMLTKMLDALAGGPSKEGAHTHAHATKVIQRAVRQTTVTLPNVSPEARLQTDNNTTSRAQHDSANTRHGDSAHNESYPPPSRDSGAELDAEAAGAPSSSPGSRGVDASGTPSDSGVQSTTNQTLPQQTTVLLDMQVEIDMFGEEQSSDNDEPVPEPAAVAIAIAIAEPLKKSCKDVLAGDPAVETLRPAAGTEDELVSSTAQQTHDRVVETDASVICVKVVEVGMLTVREWVTVEEASDTALATDANAIGEYEGVISVNGEVAFMDAPSHKDTDLSLDADDEVGNVSSDAPSPVVVGRVLHDDTETTLITDDIDDPYWDSIAPIALGVPPVGERVPCFQLAAESPSLGQLHSLEVMGVMENTSDDVRDPADVTGAWTSDALAGWGSGIKEVNDNDDCNKVETADTDAVPTELASAAFENDDNEPEPRQEDVSVPALLITKAMRRLSAFKGPSKRGDVLAQLEKEISIDYKTASDEELESALELLYSRRSTVQSLQNEVKVEIDEWKAVFSNPVLPRFPTKEEKQELEEKFNILRQLTRHLVEANEHITKLEKRVAKRKKNIKSGQRKDSFTGQRLDGIVAAALTDMQSQDKVEAPVNASNDEPPEELSQLRTESESLSKMKEDIDLTKTKYADMVAQFMAEMNKKQKKAQKLTTEEKFAMGARENGMAWINKLVGDIDEEIESMNAHLKSKISRSQETFSIESMRPELEPEPPKLGECAWVIDGSVLDNFSFIRFIKFRQHIDFHNRDFSVNPSLSQMLQLGEKDVARNVINLEKDISDIRMEINRLYLRRKEHYNLQVALRWEIVKIMGKLISEPAKVLTVVETSEMDLKINAISLLNKQLTKCRKDIIYNEGALYTRKKNLFRLKCVG